MEKLSEAQRAELQKLQLDRRRRLTKVEQENTAAIQETSRWLRRVLAEKTKSLIDAVGNDFGFDLILIRTPGEVAFARKGVDITERILQRAGVTSEVENTEGQVTGGDDTGEPTETPN